MAITPGTRLGPYEVRSAIGAGGMGEVYNARDTRLDRIVAIKVVPPHLADKPDLRERFEREAKTIASLNHPHICTLYDTGRQDGTDFLVMEYLEGETLASRLLKGALPLDQVFRYAIEIADALDKAHRKGITHRDLKPGNIMLTKNGAKLLDFGLAKLKEAAAPAESVSQMPTLSHTPTAQGTLLGTMQYMAPEQVEGKNDEVDARTDIFAFGAVVYEMATGKKAFEGKTNASVMSKIMQVDPPPMSSLQPMTPPGLDRIVKRCLAKDPEDRWQTARDLQLELKANAEGGSQVAAIAAAPAGGIGPVGRRPLVFYLGALLLAAIASVGAWNLKTIPAAPRPVTRATITLPQGQQLAGLNSGPSVALSPDGTQLAYVASEGGAQRIYLRAMDSLESRPVAGTEGAINPFFSPDSQWVGFFAGGKLKKVSVSGGTPRNVADVSVPRGASWSSLGSIAFSPTPVSVIQDVSDAGGTPKALTHLGEGYAANGWADFLPGGKAMLFAEAGSGVNWNDAKIVVQSVETGERRDLIPGGTYPRYASSGHLVYLSGRTLMAAPFDLQRLEVTGAAVPTGVEGLQSFFFSGQGQYSFSKTGSLVYVAGGAQSGQTRPVWISRNGTEQPLAAPARNYSFPRLSPDGRRLAVSVGDQATQLWLYDLSREALTRFTFAGSTNVNSAWTPDGKRVAFMSIVEGQANMYWQMADGGGGLERLSTSKTNQVPRSWSPDGKLLAFMNVSRTTGFDIWVLRMSDRKAEPFLRTPFNETVPAFSPDGHWLAYMSDESGRYEIYVRPYPGPGGQYQISTEGGREPVWNPKGGELFYRSGDKMMAVEVASQPNFTAGKPRVLFEGPYAPSPATFPNYDVSPDGQRFLMLKPAEQTEAGPTQINIVLNWFEELKRLAPTGTK